MHHEKINILFVLNQAKTNQKGVSPIYFRITINKVRKQFSTGLTINPKDWNSKKQLAESKLIDYSVLNGQLSIIKQKINNYYFKLQLENESVKIEDLIDAYFQKPTKKEDSVLSYFQKSKLLGICFAFQRMNWLQVVSTCLFCNKCYFKQKYKS